MSEPVNEGGQNVQSALDTLKDSLDSLESRIAEALEVTEAGEEEGK